MSILRIEILTGQPINLNNMELRVRSQVIQLQLPVANGGLIWNRPVAVVVRTSDGQEQQLPILDLTRTIVWLLLGFCLLSVFRLLLLRPEKYES